MTSSSVPPVIPNLVPGVGASVGPVGRGRRPLPIPALDAASPPETDTFYALSTVDKSGRVADRGIVRALGWPPGTRLVIREQAGILVATTAPDGIHRVDDRGHLHLPLPVRRWWRLGAGDRVLLAADCGRGVLFVHPLSALHQLLAGVHAPFPRGEAR